MCLSNRVRAVGGAAVALLFTVVISLPAYSYTCSYNETVCGPTSTEAPESQDPDPKFWFDDDAEEVAVVWQCRTETVEYECLIDLDEIFGSDTFLSDSFEDLDAAYIEESSDDMRYEKANPDDRNPGECTAGNPISITTGEKTESVVDYASNHTILPLVFQREYTSKNPGVLSASHYIFGGNWRDNLTYRIIDTTDNSGVRLWIRGLAGTTRFNPALPNIQTLNKPTRRDNGWEYITENNHIETYNQEGYLTRITDGPSGIYIDFIYDNNKLVKVRRNDGSELNIKYPRSHSISVDLPTGGRMNYRLEHISDAHYPKLTLLKSVTGTGFNSQTPMIKRTYSYGDPERFSNQDKRRHLLTSHYLSDSVFSTGIKLASWEYDDQKRGITSTHYKSDGSLQEKITFDRSAEKKVITTNMRGAKTEYTITNSSSGPSWVRSIKGLPIGQCQESFTDRLYSPSIGKVVAVHYNDESSRTGALRDVFYYDERGLLEKKTTSESRAGLWGFDLAGDSFFNKFAPPVETSYSWHQTDGRRLKSKTYDGNTTEYFYHHQNPYLLRRKNVEGGGEIKYDYNFYSSGRIMSIVETNTLPGSARTSTSIFHSNGNMLAKVSGKERIEYLSYNKHGSPETVVYNNSVTYKYKYNAYGDVYEMTVKNSHGESTWKYIYEPDGLIKMEISPMGLETKYFYTPGRKLDYLVLPNGDQEKYFYDDLGKLNRTQRLRNSIVKYEENRTYDERGRLEKTIYSDDEETTFRYNADNSLNTIIHEDGTTTNYDYERKDDSYEKIISVNQANLTTTTTNNDIRGYSSTTNIGDVNFGRTIDDKTGLVKKITNGEISYNFDYQSQGSNQNTLIKSQPVIGSFEIEVCPPYSSCRTVVGQGTVMVRTEKTDTKDGQVESVRYETDVVTDNPHINVPASTVALYDVPREFAYKYYTSGVAEGKLESSESRHDNAHYSKTRYQYDNKHGSLSRSTHYVDNTSYSVNRHYNQDGQLNRITYPSGLIVYYMYTDGQISAITSNNINIASEIEFEPLGPLSKARLGNGDTIDYKFDTNYKITDIESQKLNLDYDYDRNQRLEKITDNIYSNLTADFKYDATDRLKEVSQKGVIEIFGYNAEGDRTSRTRNGVSQPQKLSTPNDLGNYTGFSGSSLAYASDNRLYKAVKQGTTTFYSYNADNQRVKKKVGNNTYHFIYDVGAERLLAEYKNGSLEKEYIWLGDRLIAIRKAGQFYYVYSDHLNRPQVITNANKTTVWRAENSAFDRKVVVSNSSFGDMHIGLPGQYYDEETGLWYNWHRYYSAEEGRYLRADPIGLAGGTNLYAYASNNPVRNIDPQGLAQIISGYVRNPAHSFGEYVKDKKNYFQNTAMGRAERRLHALNERWGKEIEKRCGKDSLEMRLFNTWKISVNPRLTDSEHQLYANAYGFTRFHERTTVFNYDFFQSKRQSFIFLHEFRHLHPDNYALKDEVRNIKHILDADNAQSTANDPPADKDADRWARELMDQAFQ